MSGHDLDYSYTPPAPPAPAEPAAAPGRWARARGWLRDREHWLYPLAVVLLVLAGLLWLGLVARAQGVQRAADQRTHAELIERLQAQARADGHAAGYAAGLASAQARADHLPGVGKKAPAALQTTRPRAPAAPRADHAEQALEMVPAPRWGTTDLDRALAAWPAE
jgi:hypothetical protein